MRRLIILFILSSIAAHAQQPRMTADLASALIKESYSVQRLTAEGQLLYESTAFAQRRTWGQYCGAAWLLNEQGEFRRAIRTASMALFLGQQERNEQALAFAKRDLAVSYSYSGNLDLAEKYARESIDHRNTYPRDVHSVSFKTLGDVALRRGDARKALEHYREALGNSSGAWRRLVRISQSSAMLAAGDLDGARNVIEEIRSFTASPEREMAARLYGNFLLATNKPEEAIAEFRKYGAAASGEDGSYHRVWAHEGEARALTQKGDSTAARAALLMALDEAERVRARFRSEEFKTGVFGDMQDIFLRASMDLAQSGEVAKALDIAERARARALVDAIRERVRTGSVVMADPLGAIVPANDLPKWLAEDETLLVYLTGADKSAAWVVDRSGIRYVPIAANRVALGASVQRLRVAITERSSGIRESSAALYDTLIRPLGIDGAKRLTIVPHDTLHHLPFQALWDGKRYLIEQASIAYAPSASTLVQIVSRNNQSRPKRMLAFGNPDIGDTALALPGAEVEVTNIKTTFPDARIYLRKDATRARFLEDAPQYSLVHVAAHAEFDEVDPLYSRIRLAADKGTFGNVEAHEVYRLSLGASSLVTISACESGMSRITRGDEIWGFTRSFLAAGAPAVLLSLWPVADDSTEKLMTTFYKALQTSSARDSLREAQIAVLGQETFAHPFFWAAFNLNGDGR